MVYLNPLVLKDGDDLGNPTLLPDTHQERSWQGTHFRRIRTML